MITKDGVIYRAFEGDYHPVNIFVGENKVAGYVSEIAEGQEIEMEGTYNDSYDGIKLFGKSEQKAEWRQAEGVTNQNGEPSPESPVDMISNIPAGSYQIPTENGIYEVTLAEDLRGIDDSWRDRICFDSVSGTGYLEQNTQKDHIKDYTVNTYQPQTDETLHCGYEADFDKDKLTWSQVTHVLCTHFKSTNDLADKFKDNIRIYKPAGDGLNVWFDIRKEHLKSYGDSIINWINANDPIVILPRTTPLKTALTFTKVESSSLPVLPWTAYGRNLLDIERLRGCLNSYPNGSAVTYLDNGYRLKNETDTINGWQFRWQTNRNAIKLEPNTDYIIRFDYKVISGDTWGRLGLCKNFIGTGNADFLVQMQCNVSGIYSASFNSGACDTAYLFMNLNNASTAVPLEKEYTNIMICKGNTSTYEPFNPTPPEALEVSPDYPQKIYDLSGVTVTSRGRNLFDENTYPCVFNGTQSVNYQVPINAKTAGAYTLYCVISGMDDISFSAAGGLVSVEMVYSDGTYQWDSFAESSNAVDDVVIITTNANKKLIRVRIWKHDRFTGGTITLKNVSILEGTYTAETLPPFDRYRCTEAKVPVTLRSCGEDKDYLQKDGQAIKRYQWIAEYELGAVNRGWLNNYGSASDPRCHYFIRIGDGFDVCKFGTTGKTSHGFQITVLGESYDYMAYLHVPWSVLGFTSVPSVSEANEALAGYFSAQKANGTPVIIQYVLKEPIITDITDTELGQDFLNLKTAQYYTKLSADKETGGLKCLYRTFVPDSGSVIATDYLLTSDGEYVVTNDGKTVIQF